MGMRIKKGDTVVVVRGDEKGKRGKVLRIDPEGRRVVVENVNYIKKHLRRSQQNPRGGRIEKEAPIDLSNVMVVCPETNKPTRIEFVYTETSGGKRIKQRKCKVSGAILA